MSRSAWPGRSRTWPADDSTRAILARTNRELLPAVAVSLELGLPFRAPRIELPIESPGVDEVLDRARPAGVGRGARPPLARTGPRRHGDTGPARGHCRAAGLGGEGDLCRSHSEGRSPSSAIGHLRTSVATARARLADLRRDDAPLTLATAHATKGLEFDHVIVTGMEAGRFPSARSVDEAVDPANAYEEERRLAYVAWTRARRTLLLSFDPAVPSPFLLEAFTPADLGVPTTMPA